MPREIVYFVHISDTHIGATPDFMRHGHHAYGCAERVVEIINNLPVALDFVVHTGDIVYHPDPRAYRLAARLFEQLNAPVYYVAGNHDRARDIHHFLPMGPRDDVSEDRDLLSYTFTRKGYRFLVLDGRGPDEIDPHGLYSSEQLARVGEEAVPAGPPLTVFTHFPTLPLNSVWMDAYMLAINGHLLHRALLPARDRLRGVFHGHVHQHMQTRRDGILYVSVASVFSQFAAWPRDVEVQFDSDHPPGYSFTSL